MRRAKTLSGHAVEALVEEERIPPHAVFLRAEVGAMRRPPTIGVEHE
jgi:hypothetical protein